MDSVTGSFIEPAQIFTTCKNDSTAIKDCAEELINECCTCRQIWYRIVIDVAVILGVLFLIILIFLVVRFCRNRQRGMFDDWQPRSSGQTRQVESGSSRSGDDRLHRNHSYRNLSGSSTLDRGLESVEQASAVMAASGVTAMVRSLNDDSGNRYGSLPAPAKGASARGPSATAVNTNLVKPTTGTSPAEMLNKGNSSDGEYYDPDSLQTPDQQGNPPAPPDSKSKPKHNSKTCQKEPAEDTAKEEDNVLDKSKRRSLFNIMSKGSRMPSSPRPSKDEDDFPKDPESIMDRHRDCRYGKKNRKKSETTDRRRSCSVSKDEEVFEDPKSYTLPNDIYAIPNKPAFRNKQPKKMSDSTKGAKSGDVEPQEGYSRLSRLFKPRAFGKGKSKQGDDTTSPEEYSDYNKLGGHEDPDVPVTVDKAESDCKPFEGMYALVDDNGYAVVGEGMTAASQSGDYEMIAHGQMK
ncbi:uncharacterized protein LOC100891671 [Strongylocentrotus purpuratus]|uniref:Uncharacterized protein n=1 Tax=Strongylocentrotus purpuratus TaxID=7668 RepID=A0A7M7NPA3_STRPU|nr:uncharacterized protein LOC100891671 [Strongylocentrotus purpuratus]|eukprot:XP_003725097.2 PREDICTED: uncharacterized protein LOC100891671 [Strongylocentrotus purpuratus]